MAWDLEKVYKRIKSGGFWSDRTEDYFDMVALHPYHMSTKLADTEYEMWVNIEEPDNLWKDYVEAVYRVMCKYGDEKKQVIMTEIGFTDCGEPELEERNAGYTKKIMKMARELPFVRTFFNFRLLVESAMLQRKGASSNQIGGLTEGYFCMFTEPKDGCEPRKQAFAVQELTGSKADLYEIGKQIAQKSR